MSHSLATLSAFDMICRTRWPDDSVHWCHFRAGHRIGADGLVLCEGIALDITALERAEQALVETQTQRQAILAAIPDLMFLTTIEGVYLDAHYKDPADLAAPIHQLLGRNISDVLPPDLARQIHDALLRVRLDGEAVIDYVLTLKGQRRHFEARLAQCGADKVLSIVRDITEIKRSQAEAHLHRLELAHVSRVTSLAEITASLAHELNQPLTASSATRRRRRGRSRRGKLTLHEYRDILDDIVEAGQRAGDVIARLRGLAGSRSFQPQSVDVNQVIMHVEHLIRSELILRQVRLTLELQAGLPDGVRRSRADAAGDSQSRHERNRRHGRSRRSRSGSSSSVPPPRRTRCR